MAARKRVHPITAIASVLSLVSMQGCAEATGGMRFVRDDRLSIVEPAIMSTVTMPLRIRWTGKFPAGQRFGVFVERPPVRPGASLRTLAANDRACMADAACPDRAYLQALNVYVTSSTEVLIESVPAGRYGASTVAAQIILLDERGLRVGESAWSVRFRVASK